MTGMALQPDGKILAAVGTRVWRLNIDGSVDGSFFSSCIGD